MPLLRLNMQLPYSNLFNCKKKGRIEFLILFTLIFISNSVIARPGGGGHGGGGGGHSGGGGGGFGSGGSGGTLSWSATIFLLVIYLIVLYIKWTNTPPPPYHTPEKIQKKLHDEGKINSLLSDLADFNRGDFYQMVDKLFFKMQVTWVDKNINPIRQYISDGVYQRFNAQFIMMNELGQTNFVSDVKLLDKEIVAVENDGNFQVLHVLIRATNDDLFESTKFSELNSGGYEEYTEYWTFVKKINSKKISEKSFYLYENCPNCGDSLKNKLGEISICPSCKALINNGDYNWVLSEITQAEQFASTYSKLKTRNKFYEKLAYEGYNSYEYSPQYLEDKASNAYLQIKIAQALRDPKRVNRFCSDNYTQKLNNLYYKPYLYNRLFTKSVELINILSNSKDIFAVVSISCAQQKIVIENNELQLINNRPIEVNEFLILSRSKKSFANKYSAMSHNCSGCGAPVEDSLQLTCKYCNGALNDNSKDWIIENLCNKKEYIAFRDSFNNTALTKKQEQRIENKNYQLKDYALNNMMMVAMADGEMHDKERAFLNGIAKKLGYNSKKISELFNQVRGKDLTIKMPSDPEKAKKVLKLMHSIANSDNEFKAKEKEMINEAEKIFGVV